MTQIQEVAFPRLTSAEVALVKPLATARDYADGETIFRAGQADIDLYIVESGQVEIRNPTDGQRVIAVHEPGQFSGDIDLLTGRPVHRDRRGAGQDARPLRARQPVPDPC